MITHEDVSSRCVSLACDVKGMLLEMPYEMQPARNWSQ